MIGTLAAIGAGLNILGGVGKLVSGSKRARRAQKAIDNYQRQTLTNAYDQVGVSTLGADLQRQENARATATTIDALRSFGTRGLSQLGNVVMNNNVMNRNIAADLDRQRQQINMAKAQDDARIRQMQERREEVDLAGLGQQLNVGRQDGYSGLGDIASGVGSAAMMGGTGMFNNPTPRVQGVTPMAPQGLTAMGGLTPQAQIPSNYVGGKAFAPMIPGSYNQITAPLLV